MNTILNRWNRSGSALALGTLIGFSSYARGALEAVPVIEPVDLAVMLGATHSEAVAVNDLGQVVINTEQGQGHAYLWSAESGFVDLGTLGGSWSRAAAINSAGTVVGTSGTATHEIRAFLWTPETGIQNLGTVESLASSAGFINDPGQVAGGLSGPTTEHAASWGAAMEIADIHDDALGVDSLITGLNNLGQAVGWTFTPPLWSFRNQAFIWDEVAGMRRLEPADGYNWGEAMAVNDRGEVVGYSYNGEQLMLEQGACLWRPEGVPVILEQTETLFSRARDVNNAGQIVGCSRNEQGFYRATLWIPEADDIVQIDLGILDQELLDSYAVAINELGQVVGHCIGGSLNKPCRIMAWTNAEGMLELGDLGLQRSGVKAINNLGLAVGNSQTVSNEWHACVWQLPLPPLTPEEKVDAVIDEVLDLIDTGGLSEGDGAPLLASLDAAADKLDEGNTQAVENILEAFINKIEAKVKSGKLTPEEGAALIEAALAALEG